jgi:hypothetical protein
MAEMIICIAILGVIAAVAISQYTVTKSSVVQSKLQTDVQKLNQFVGLYLADGGDLSSATTVAALLNKLKTIRATADTKRQTGALTGRLVDVRLMARTQTAAEVAAGGQNVVWNPVTYLFEIKSGGTGGAVAEFYLDDTYATTDFGTETRIHSGLLYNDQATATNGWVWNIANPGSNWGSYINPDNRVLADQKNIFDPTLGPPAFTLPTPYFNPVGGTYAGPVFPSSVAISANGAPTSGTILQYQISHADGSNSGWTNYTTAIAIIPGDSVSAKNVSTNTSRYFDSTTYAQTYNAIATTLPTPVITTTGGSFPKASFPSTVAITTNGAPAGTILQYQITHSNGVATAWANYTTPVAITYGDVVTAKNVSGNSALYADSTLASQTYTLQLTTLPTPVISPSGGSFAAASLPSSVTISSNSAPSPGSKIQYQLTHNAATGAWTDYTGAVTIASGDSVTAKNTSTDNTLYQDSAVNVQTYTVSISKLPTPIITPTGGAFVSTSFPATASISANGAPGSIFSVLQYRITPSGGSAGAWTNYSSPVALTYGDKVEARNNSYFAFFYTTSNTTSQTYSLSLSTLPTPVNTPNGGTFTGDTFPGSVSVSSNGAPGGANSKLQYRKTTGGVVGAWTDYTTAITITYNDKIESKNVALNTTSYADSSVDTDTYTLAFTTLPKPINTPTGGGFAKGVFPTSVTVSSNGAPGGAFSVLQYRKTTAAGVVGTWTTYTAAIPISYNETIESRNLTLNSTTHGTSATDTDTYTLTTIVLPTPTITPTGGGYAKGSFPASVTIGANGAPGGTSSVLKYRRTTGGVVGAWTNYTSAVAITYGDTIEAQNVALDTSLYSDSLINTQTYLLTTIGLPIPIITPPGGTFPVASFPGSVTISPNGAPASQYTLKYRRTTGGVTGAWTTYTSAVAITYGDTVEAQNVAIDPLLYSNSGIASETYLLSVTALPMPVITPTGGSFVKASFPGTVTVTANGAPGGSFSTLQYRRTTGGVTGAWTTYSSAIAITYGDVIEARNLSTNAATYSTSTINYQAYNLSVTTLQTPINTPNGGTFSGASFPSTVSISANGAPGGTSSQLQYMVTHSNGTSTAWTAYSTPVAITYGDTVTSRNLALDTTLYGTSASDTDLYSLTMVTLPTPINSPTGGAWVKASFPSSVTVSANGAPGGSNSTLQYRITNASGTVGVWTTYASAFGITYGDTVESRNLSTNTTAYNTSASDTDLYTLTLTTLPTPVITPAGGSFSTATFPGAVTITSNGAPGGSSSVLKYRKTTGGTVGAWTNYSSAVAIAYGDTVEAQNVSTDSTLYSNSVVNSQTYTVAVSTLPTPIITPAGGTFTGATFPSSIAISANGAPGGTSSALQYRITHSNGVVTAWTNYTSAVAITYGDTVAAKNTSLNTVVYGDSAITSQSYAIFATTLPTPVITPTGGTFTVTNFPGTISISNNNPPNGVSTLQYQVTHTNGSSTAWTNYTTPITITYGDTVAAKNVSSNVSAYTDSPAASQNYAITAMALPTPIITPTGGSFTAATFPSTISISSNGAPGGTSSQLQYMITHKDNTSTAWTAYTTGFAVVTGDTVTAKNLSTNTQLYTTSASTSQNYIKVATFTGTDTPAWINVSGGPNLLYTATNSNPASIKLTHGNTQLDLGGGQVVDAGVANTMTFDRGTMSGIGPNTDFSLGNLVILNGTTFNDSEATAATLKLVFAMTAPSVSNGTVNLNFTMASTANTSDRAASADTVTLQSNVTSFSIVQDGTTYTLQVWLVSSDTANGFLTGNTFSIYEGSSASATLMGRFVSQ